MALDIFIAFLLQIAFSIGVIFLLGWLIALCNKVFYSNFGRFGNIVCYITGFVGAPIHELSHALFCLIFFHRIREIKLFQISDDGTMGYVIHSYNRRNMYQRIGNFFIGVAPILVMSGLLFLLAWGLLPEFISDIGGFITMICYFFINTVQSFSYGINDIKKIQLKLHNFPFI